MRFDEFILNEDYGINQQQQVEHVTIEIQPVAVVVAEVTQENFVFYNESGAHYAVNQEFTVNYDYSGGGDGASGSGSAGGGSASGGTGCGGNGGACGSDGSA